jgi:hypothetical protein
LISLTDSFSGLARPPYPEAFMTSFATRFRLRSAASLAGMLLASQLAWAVEPFTVRDIRVEGLQRVEPGTVFGSLPLRVGETYNDDKGAAAIRALFGLGTGGAFALYQHIHDHDHDHDDGHGHDHAHPHVAHPHEHHHA